MLTAITVYTLLAKFQPYAADVGEVGRQDRLQILANSITKAALLYPDPPGVAARLAALGEHETHFSKRVHVGACLDYECDPKLVRGLVVHQAAGPWQAHKLTSLPQEQWVAMVGATQEATDAMAVYVAKLFMAYERRCGTGAEGGFAGYATGLGCRWVDAKPLAAKVERYRLFLVRAANRS